MIPTICHLPLALLFAFWIFDPPRGLIPALIGTSVYSAVWIAVWIIREIRTANSLRERFPEVYHIRKG
jgi:hypothetical protein